MTEASLGPVQFNAIQVHSAPEALAQQIVERIRSGALAPGTRLPSQRELARRFGVGLGSVREAIKILNVMGYLRVIRGKGTFTSDSGLTRNRSLSAFDQIMKAVSLAELMAAREVVECGAARLAAEAADADNIARLKKAAARMDVCGQNSEAYYQSDFMFHIAVADASNNPAIAEIVKRLVDKSHYHIEFMNESLGISMPANARNCIHTAKQTVAFIASGNGPASAEAMKAHLNIVNIELTKVFSVGRPLNGEMLDNPGTNFLGRTSTCDAQRSAPRSGKRSS